MPLYEYACASCGAQFEILAATAPENPPCAHCGSRDTSREVSCPSPLKKGAFPFKPGPVHPLAHKMAAGPACGSCGHKG